MTAEQRGKPDIDGRAPQNIVVINGTEYPCEIFTCKSEEAEWGALIALHMSVFAVDNDIRTHRFATLKRVALRQDA